MTKLDSDYWNRRKSDGPDVTPSNGGQISTPDAIVRNDPRGIPGGRAIDKSDLPPPPKPQR